MTVKTDQAWYVYNVLPATALAPPVDGVLPDVTVEAMHFDDLAVLASVVPRELFDSTNPANRTADPVWMGARIEAHHAVNVAATEAGPCLPLAFGALFSSVDRVRNWLTPRAGKLLAALEGVAGQEEWALSLQQDVTEHAAWLEDHDAALKALAASVAAAGEGTAFLMTRRLDKARTAAQIAHIAAVATTVSSQLAAAGLSTLDEPPPTGLPTWTVLVARPVPPANDKLPDLVEALAPGLLSTGLSLHLSGPWPAYAFARAALVPETVNG
jgi:hypothetical protein